MKIRGNLEISRGERDWRVTYYAYQESPRHNHPIEIKVWSEIQIRQRLLGLHADLAVEKEVEEAIKTARETGQG